MAGWARSPGRRTGRRLAFTAEVDPPRWLVGPVARVGTTDKDSPRARRIDRIDWRWDEEGHLDRWSHLWVVDLERGRRAAAGHERRLGRQRHRLASRRPDRGLRQRSRAAPGPRAAIHDLGGGRGRARRRGDRGAARGPRPGRRGHQARGLPGRPLGRGDRRAGDRAARRHQPDRAGRAGRRQRGGDRRRPRPGPRPAHRQLGRQRPDGLDGLGTARPRLDRRDDDRRDGLGPGPLAAAPVHAGCRAAARPATGGPSTGTSSPTRSRRARAATTGRRPSPFSRRTVPGRWSSPRSSCPATSRARRTRIGSAWQDRFAPIEMRLVQAPGAGGPIDVWMATLAGAADERLPTVVDVHGGPLGAWAPSPHVEVILLASAGYRVVLPNIRGSATYGGDWIRPQLGDWGGVDADDVHAAIDHVIGLGLDGPRSARDPRPELRRVHGQLDGRHDRPLPGGRLRQRRHQPDQRVGQLRLRPRVRPDGA